MIKSILGLSSLFLLALLTLGAAAPPNLAEALATQRALVIERPADWSAYNDLGNLLVLAGDLEAAEGAYRRAIELDPAGTPARFNLAVLLQQRGMWKSAFAELRDLLEVDPWHARGHYQLGLLHAQRRNRGEALEHYARAFALDPTLTFARVNPHIIDNELATEAILLSQRYLETPSATVPRLYGEPERIAALMLRTDEPPAPAAGETVDAADDEMVDDPAAARRAGRDRLPGSPATFDEEDDSDGVDAPAKRQLTKEDLGRPRRGERDREAGAVAVGAPRTRTTQETAPGVDAPRALPRRPGAVAPDASGRTDPRRQRTTLRRRTPATTAPAPTPDDGRAEPARPQPQRRPRYVPSRGSTSRLDFELLPASETGGTALGR